MNKKVIVILVAALVSLFCCFVSLVLTFIYIRSKDSANQDSTNKNKAPIYEALISDVPQESRKFYSEATKLWKNGDYKKALDSINEAEKISPDSYPIMSDKCLLLTENFDISEETIKYCEKVYQIHPNAPHTLSNLAMAYYMNGDCENTLRLIKELDNLELDDLDNEDKGIMLGNMGLYSAWCEGDVNVSSKYLQQAIRLETNKEDKQINQDELDRLSPLK